MELSFEKDELLDNLQTVQGVTSGRNTLPILSNVLIRAQDEGIECAATDLEVGIKVKVDGTIADTGEITVSAKRFVDLVRELPDKSIKLVTTANDRIELTCGDGTYKIIGLSSEQFPPVPSANGEGLTIDGEMLNSVIRKTVFAASTEEVQFLLNGLYFNLLEDRTEVVATDRNYLAIAHCVPLQTPEDVEGFIVPLKAVKEIQRTFADSERVRISLQNSQLLFSDENATLMTRLVEGRYPEYQAIIPESTGSHVIVSKDTILRASRRVSLLSNPKNHAICLEIDTERIHLSANTPELGEAHETIAVESGNGSVRIGLDARMLTDVLSHIETTSLVLEFSDEASPFLVKPEGDDGHLCIISPMRLDAIHQ